MVNCFLCFSEDKRRRFLHYHSILTSNRTVADVVQEYFPAVPQNIARKPSICSKCYTTMKQFSELVDIVQITHSFPKISLVKCETFDVPPIKIEPEPIETVSAFEFYASCHADEIDEAKEKIEIMQEEIVESLPRPPKKATKRPRTSFKDDDSHDEDYTNRNYKNPRIKVVQDERTVEYIEEFVTFKCYVCDVEFPTFGRTTRHIRKAHPQNAAYIPCCSKAIKTPSQFNEHIRIFHLNDGTEFDCKQCRKKFKTSSQLYQHEYSQHPTFKCKTCGFKVPTEGALEIHTKFHELDSCQFQCYKCKHECSGYYTLKSHLKEKHRLKRNRKSEKFERQCDRCGFMCKNKMRLQSHVAKHLEQDLIDRGEGVSCPKCKRKFVNEKKLHQHDAKWHKKADHAICEICSKLVLNLKVHKKVHEKSERVKCPHCDRYLKNDFVLKNHIKRIHPEDPNKKFICKECGKVLNSAASLWNHVKLIHKLKRNLPCRFCPKLMITPTDVKEHEATHTGIDLYFCEWCPKSFKFGASYRGHRKREHKGEYIPRSEIKSYIPSD